MDDLTAAGPALLALFGMIFAAAVAGPRVVWVRGSFGIHYQSSLRWPPVRPENLDHRYRYDDWHTKFQTTGAVLAVGLNQQLWSAHPWWVFASRRSSPRCGACGCGKSSAQMAACPGPGTPPNRSCSGVPSSPPC